ncbi:MAG: PHP domain-containing protein [Chloroflexia bacterium]|nr:PHP domain-containing protein [Chloroflexia bacterium]
MDRRKGETGTPPNGWLRADLHMHTDASGDSLLSPIRLLRACQKRGLDCVAVTDHNRLDGARAVAALAPPDLMVILGEEVMTAQGELLGLFLQHEIPPGGDPLEVARQIRSQGGLVGAPHPCDVTRHQLLPEALNALHRTGLLDFIEGRNGRATRNRYNQRAEELGRRLGLPLTAGSDAHSAGEVGRCYTWMPPFDGPRSFLEALRQAELHGQRSRLWSKFSSIWARLRRLRRRG